MSIVAPTSATPELLDLFDHEKVIEQGLASFIDVGMALLAIKADKKYRHVGYATFEDYCDQRWNISRNYGHKLILAASTAESLMGTNVHIPMPEREGQVRPLTMLKDNDAKREAWAEAVKAADGGQPTAKQVEAAVVKRQPPKKDHPATFSDAILSTIAGHLPTEGVVLDPFAGTGRIHELATDQRQTVGIEIEAEWAARHPDTIHGDALETMRAMPNESVDAISTSPTYGNRMADHHDAKDDSVRLTYKHTLGHDLADTNSGAMQWGPEYRAFHLAAWRDAVAVLRPGGTFTLNIKNHVRDGVVQRVAEWHITTLIVAYGLDLEALDVVPTRGLMAGANADTRTAHEFVATFRKEELI